MSAVVGSSSVVDGHEEPQAIVIDVRGSEQAIFMHYHVNTRFALN